jgi:hypothetical protein
MESIAFFVVGLAVGALALFVFGSFIAGRE